MRRAGRRPTASRASARSSPIRSPALRSPTPEPASPRASATVSTDACAASRRVVTGRLGAYVAALRGARRIDVIGKGEGSQVAGHGRVLTGDRHMVAAGHYAAAHAGFLILEAGGNAVDAGVAAGIALGVLHSDIVNVAGVAPIMIRLADSQEVVTIDGLGVWPAAASAEFFRREHGGRIPDGLLRTVTPAAPAAWIAALERFGTMSFGEVARFAIGFAADGFPVHSTMAEFVGAHAADYARYPRNAELYLPEGRPVEAGGLLVQPELAATLQHMVDEERAHSGRSRSAGLAAARATFYEGDIAAKIAT